MENITDISRKKIFINKKFQTKFIFRFSIFFILSTLLLSVFIFYSSGNSTTVVFKNLRLESLPTHDYLLPSITIGIILSLVLTSFFSIISGLIYSHRIVGPLYRFEQILAKIKEGDLTQSVHLREFDECKSTALALNSSIISMKERFQQIDFALTELEKHISKYDPKISNQVEKIRSELSKLQY